MWEEGKDGAEPREEADGHSERALFRELAARREAANRAGDIDAGKDEINEDGQS